MIDRFPTCLATVLRLEGGYSNHKRDRGGATMNGVTQKTFNAYLEARGQPPRDVRTITAEERRELYYLNYWLPSGARDLPPGVDLAVFDFAVHSGPVTAIRALQRVLGVKVDGHYGAVTDAAVRRTRPAQLIVDYIAARAAWLATLPDADVFGAGWQSRCRHLEVDALASAGAQEWLAEARFEAEAVPMPEDLDQRSADQGRAVAVDPRPPVMAELGAAGAGGGTFTFALPNIIARSFPGGRFSWVAFAIALTSEPAFWMALAMLAGAFAMWRWRAKIGRLFA